MPQTIWTEGDRPPPVSPDHPLEGIETTILRVWLENSRPLRQVHRQDPAPVENAVRQAYAAAWEEELKLRAGGLTLEQAQELTRPAMWTPPAWPTPPSKRRKRP